MLGWRDAPRGRASPRAMQHQEYRLQSFTFIPSVSTGLDQSCHEICSSVKPADALFRTKEKQNFLTQCTALMQLSQITENAKN